MRSTRVGRSRLRSVTGRGRRRGHQPVAEGLEPRRVLSTRTWISASGGAFQAPANWMNSLVPGAADAAAFNLANSGITTFTGVNPTNTSLSVADPSFSVVATSHFFLNDPNNPSLANATTYTLANAANVGVNGSGSLEIQAGDVVSNGSATIGQTGNGFVILDAGYLDSKTGNKVPAGSLSVAGGLQVGQYSNNSFGTIQRGVVKGPVVVNAGSAVVDHGSIQNVALVAQGPVLVTNDSQVAGSLSGTAIILGKSSLGLKVNVTGSVAGSSITMSGAGFTDTASLTVPPAGTVSASTFIAAASRTSGSDDVNLFGDKILGPAIWAIGGPATIGQFGGQASLSFSNEYVIATDDDDVIVGNGTDAATGTPSQGTVNMNTGDWPIAGNLILAPNSGVAALNVQRAHSAVAVGKTVQLNQNATIKLQNNLLQASAINNGGGAISGYGILLVKTPLASNNFAINNPTGAVTDFPIAVGDSNAYVYSNAFPTIRLDMAGGTVRAINGTLNGFYAVKTSDQPPGDHPVISGFGSVLSPVTVLDPQDGFAAKVVPSGVLNITDFAFQDHNTMLDEGIGGGSPGASGYGQLNLTGRIFLQDAVLQAHLTNGFVPNPGQRFTIVNNDDIDPVGGVFDLRAPDPAHPGQFLFTPLAEGAVFQIDGMDFTITYKGGDGNDVQLVANRAPTAVAGGPYAVAEGGTVVLSAAGSSDPEQSASSLTYAWDLDGDGVFGEIGGPHGDEAGPSVTYKAGSLDGPSDVTVALKVTDRDGLVAQTTARVHINDAPPTATLFADASTVDEGGTTTVRFTGATDPSSADQAAGFTFGFDFNNDGGFEAEGDVPSATVPATFLADGPGTETVHGRITDKDGGFTDYTVTITIRNAPPSASLDAPATVGEGQPLAIALKDPADPSPIDAASGFTYAFDLGDGAGYRPFGPSGSATAPASRPGNRTVRAKIKDKDGGVTEYTQVVAVSNVAPTVSLASGEATLARGQALDLSGSFSDPGVEPYKGSVDFGEGSGNQPLTLQPGRTFRLLHTYALPGVYHVTVTVNDGDLGGTATARVTVTAPPVPTGDFDGDGKTDPAVFRPSTAQWLWSPSSGGSKLVTFGAANSDIPVPGDYDGDGKADLAVFRPSTAQWFILRSKLGPESLTFGAPNLDVPVVADYDGDGKADLAVFRPGKAQWFILRSTLGGQAITFGAPRGDLPVPADYDGDGRADLAVFRSSTAQWFILQSTAGGKAVTFGARSLDRPIPADYDGDGKADLAVFRPTTAQWLILQSTAGGRAVTFGAPNLDVPILGDFDGDGKADLAVYRPTTAQWFVLKSGGGAFATTVVGSTPGDVPLWPAASYRYNGTLTINRLGVLSLRSRFLDPGRPGRPRSS